MRKININNTFIPAFYSSVKTKSKRKIDSCVTKVKSAGTAVQVKIEEARHKFKETRHQIKITVLNLHYRKTEGAEFTAEFSPYTAKPEAIDPLSKFVNYRLTSERFYDKKVIGDEIKTKLNDMINEKEALAEANEPFDADERAEKEKLGEKAAQLIERSKNKKFKRSKFDGDNAEVYDKATFELVKEFTNDLCLLFNSQHLQPTADKINEKFDFDYYQAVIGEVLARSIAYNPHLDGQTMSLPVKNDDGTYEMAEFTITQYFLGEGLPSYILECKDSDNKDLHHPWFVVRGTDTTNPKTSDARRHKTGCVESVLADFVHMEGVAEGLIDDAIVFGGTFADGTKTDLLEIFEGRQFNLTGHSLGGCIVNQMATILNKNVNQAFAFGAPGVSQRIATWAQKENDENFNINKLVNIQTEGDFVPSVGRKLIGTHVALTPLAMPRHPNASHMHVLMVLTKPFKMQKIDISAESDKPSRILAEKARVKAGAVISRLAGTFNKKLPTWSASRKVERIVSEPEEGSILT